MIFAVKTLYPTDTVEAACTALLTIIALKSFEYILNALITSAGSERVSTGHFALSAASNQARNPLKLISWFRASPDFDVPPGSSSNTGRRRIPLQRATIALSITFLALLAEAAFFYGTQNKPVKITDKYLRISLNQTNEKKGTRTSRNTCKPIALATGRVHLNGVLAACNIEEGQLPEFGPGTSVTATIFRKEYSIGVNIQGSTSISSRTEFMLVLPGEENLVVGLRGDIQQHPSTEVYNQYEGLGCKLDRTREVHDLILENCTSPVEPIDTLRLIVQYIGIVHNEPPSKVGSIVGDRVSESSGNTVVGFITLQNFTAVGVLSITGVLFLLAVICNATVTDDTNEVIACILREKTGQDFDIPTIAMSEGEVRLVRSFSESKGEWHVGTFVPNGFEEKMT